MSEKTKNNYAFIDGQNLHMGTKSEGEGWKVDFVNIKHLIRRK